MERTALNRTLIEAVVTRSLNEIERDPRRGIRKMVDLGAHLAIGRSQRRFLSLIRQLLNDESTPYYELIERLIWVTTAGRWALPPSAAGSCGTVTTSRGSSPV